ncbi:MAG: ABC transporter ATP-binding protein [Dehalococcoidia bacterium]|nr:ABC transporter ATP-binding protein [Dehalococcoidia bacterium]
MIATAAPTLAFRGVGVDLGGTRVVSDVDFEVPAGELFGLVGPNGAGKSTLLRAATGVVRLASGDVTIEGAALASRARRDLARRVAVVQQLPEAPHAMTVEELVLLGRTPHLGLLARESPRDLEIATASMSRAGCEAFASRPLGTLSGGQRRRAFIARALAQEPALLLLDEPTSNLDPQAQGEIFLLLRALAAEGVAVLVVVHDLTIAAAYCDRVALLHQGRVAALGPPREVLTEEQVQRVYGPLVSVITHPVTGLPVIAPAGAPTGGPMEVIDG